METQGEIAAALQGIRERVRRAAQACGRACEEIRIVAVSKSKPASAVREAYEAGQRDFGENYVQEFVDKAQQLADLQDLRWHFIGHLQTNKARVIAERAHAVQSLDSVRLAQELGKRAAAVGRVLPVLIEVNLGAEESKSGASIDDARSLLEAARQEPALVVRGLMTVPPHELELEQAARHFRRLKEMQQQLGGEARLPEMSMGMSHDFEVAIACGATTVRVGTAIFGGR